MDYLYYHPLIVEGGRDRAKNRKNTQESMKVATDELKVTGQNCAEFSIVDAGALVYATQLNS
jgi:hypothetical protein